MEMAGGLIITRSGNIEQVTLVTTIIFLQYVTDYSCQEVKIIQVIAFSNVK